MYSDAFCKVYNQFGWNYFPEAFAGQLLLWMKEQNVTVCRSLDLGCGTGVLCEILHKNGIQTQGMDFSENMIAIARESCGEIPYEVGDMVAYRPEGSFDLVTCTGDALNHIIDMSNVEQIFRNVYGYLNEGGFFIFDILNESEISTGEAFDLDFSETVKAKFQMLRSENGIVTLKTAVFENGTQTFEERIEETVHDPAAVCDALRRSGFTVVKCDHSLLDGTDTSALTWFVIAKKS